MTIESDHPHVKLSHFHIPLYKFAIEFIQRWIHNKIHKRTASRASEQENVEGKNVNSLANRPVNF